MSRVVGFVPIKLNNQRLPNKNLLPFRGGDPLFRSVLTCLSGVPELDAVYVYCSSPTLIPLLPENVLFQERPAFLDSDETSINEIIRSFAEDVPADIYVLAHATAPFLRAETVSSLIRNVNTSDFDSSTTVLAHRDFFWVGGKPLNYDPLHVPRTQDLEPMYSETSGAWSFTRDLATVGRRIGDRPSLVEIGKIEAVDIDDPVDFAVARALLSVDEA